MDNPTPESAMPAIDIPIVESENAVQNVDLPELDEPGTQEEDILQRRCDLTPQQQREKLLPLLSKIAKMDQTWYALSKTWYTKWCSYVGHIEFECSDDINDKDAPPPGIIDNSNLIDEDYPYALKPISNPDILMIHQDLWDLLVSWWGVKEGHIFKRNVIDVDGKPNIDRFPKFVKVWNSNADGEAVQNDFKEFTFDSNKTILDIAHKMMTINEIEVDDSALRLSFKFTPESCNDEEKEIYEEKEAADAPPKFWQPIHPSDMDSKLDQIDKMDSFTEFLFECKNNAGNFPRDYELDKDNLKGLLRPGDVVDAQDKHSKWYQAVIVYVAEENFKVHFIGWQEKWDEIKPWDTDKIEPVGTYTLQPHKPLAKPAVQVYSHYQQIMEDVSGEPECRGMVGLCNLGNTCFMNSVLQCLFQSGPFRGYFLAKRYEKDINKDNPLGWSGEVANSWGGLMDKIWGNSFTTVAPKAFKKAIGKVAPRFDGFQQQDSQEFLTFLLDGLHEDLNRIKTKPATTNPESDGSIPDIEIATKSWKIFKKRNDSFLVDLLYGQLKNEIVCPKCDQTSIVFDPFTFLQLPLPVDNLREIPFTFVPVDSRIIPKKHQVKLSAVEFIRAFKAKVSECIGVKVENLRFYEVFKNKWYKPYRRFSDLESIRGLKENESFFVYEVEPLNDEELEVVQAREQEMKKDFEEGDLVMAECNDAKYYKAEISEIREVEPELPDEKPEKIYTLNFNTMTMQYSGTKRLRKILQHPPRIDVCIKHLKKSQYHNGWDEFGMPQHLFLPTKELTNQQVLQMVERKIAPYVLDTNGFTINYRYPLGATENNFRLVGNGEIFPLYRFFQWGALPEIRILWRNADGYRDEVETEVHSLQRQESARINTLSIHECLKKFCETEILDDMNMVYCSKCKEHQNSKKTASIWKLPDELIIHLKRFSYGGDFADKVKTPVSFPLVGLDLSPYMADQEHKEEYIYDLFGVSNHSGFLAGGHYTAYVRSLTDGKWWEMDDSDVSPVNDLNLIVSKRAYLLFYKKRQKGESPPMDIPVLSIDEEVGEGVATDDQELNHPQPGAANRSAIV